MARQKSATRITLLCVGAAAIGIGVAATSGHSSGGTSCSSVSAAAKALVGDDLAAISDGQAGRSIDGDRARMVSDAQQGSATARAAGDSFTAVAHDFDDETAALASDVSVLDDKVTAPLEALDTDYKKLCK